MMEAADDASTTISPPTELCWPNLGGLSTATIGALEAMNFHGPTPIQRAVIPQAIGRQRKDIIGAAETGSGKTLAFVIPILERWLEEGRQHVARDDVTLFALIISPTRELTIQIRDVIKQLTKNTGPRALSTIALVGGMSEQKQQRLLKTRPDVIVATPGRLWALRQTGDEHLEDLSGLRILVVDEIDRMLEQGHFEELRHIVHDIHRFLKEQKILELEAANELKPNETLSNKSATPRLQTLIFSATLTFTHHIPTRKGEKAAGNKAQPMDSKLKVKRIAQSMCMRKGHSQLGVFDLTPPQKTPHTLVECRMNCMDLLQKDANLFYLLKRYGGRTLVFGNSVSAIRRLQAILRKLITSKECLPRVLHGRMKERERLKSMERFEQFENSVLLATDVAARGLDFQRVQNIIHYQVPKTTESYIHRSGRTARAASAGLSVLFVDPLDLQNYQKICRNLNKDGDLELLTVEEPKLMATCQQLVELATEAESLEHRIKKRKTKDQWFERIAHEADLVWEEGNKSRSGKDDGNDGPTNEEAMERRKKSIEKALREMLKRWEPPPAAEQRRDGKLKMAKGKLGEEEIRKRIRLEKGVKRWVKRRKMT